MASFKEKLLAIVPSANSLPPSSNFALFASSKLSISASPFDAHSASSEPNEDNRRQTRDERNTSESDALLHFDDRLSRLVCASNDKNSSDCKYELSDRSKSDSHRRKEHLSLSNQTHPNAANNASKFYLVNRINDSLSQLQNNVLVDIGLFSDFDANSTQPVESTKRNSFPARSNFSSVKHLASNRDHDDDDDPMLSLDNPVYEHSELQAVSNAASVQQNHDHASNSIHSQKQQQQQQQLHQHSSDNENQEHCHVIGNDWTSDKKQNATVWRKLITVLILCVVFMVAEIVGGIIAKSIAIQTDAAHMAADIAGFFFSIVAIYVSGKAPTRRMSFGYYRSEVLGALFSILVIWVVTGVLIYLAVMRIINNNYEIDVIPMIVTASCGVFFNIVMYFILHTNKCFNGIGIKHHGHSHSDGSHNHNHEHDHEHNQEHGHEHGHGHAEPHSHLDAPSSSAHKKQKNASNSMPIDDNSECNVQLNRNNVVVVIDHEIKEHKSNINLRAAAIHVIGDFIQSVGVLLAALIIYIDKDKYKIADPICTFVFSALVILTTAPILKDIYYVLMEALPGNLKYDAVIEDLCKIPFVKKAHSLHIWCLTMEKFALSVHLVTEPNSDTQIVFKEANSLLRKKYKIERTTIQVEYYEPIMDSCNQCQLPA